MPPQPPTGDSDKNQLKEELGQANAKITKLEQSIEQLQVVLEKQAKKIFSWDTEILDLYDALENESEVKEKLISKVEDSVDKGRVH